MDIGAPLWATFLAGSIPALIVAVSSIVTLKLSNDARSRDLKAQLEQERVLRMKEWGREFRARLVQQVNDMLNPFVASHVRWSLGEIEEWEPPQNIDRALAIASAWFCYDPVVKERVGEVIEALKSYGIAIAKGEEELEKQASEEVIEDVQADLVARLNALTLAEELFIAGCIPIS